MPPAAPADDPNRVLRRLKLRDLRLLDVLARAGTMARAASELALSQAAVSKALSELERAVGVPLFERSGRGVALLPAGRVLVARGRVVFDEIAEGMREIRALDDPHAGLVRVGTTEAMAAFVAQTIETVSGAHPGIRFDVTVDDTGVLFDALRERALDAVVTRVLPGALGTDLVSRTLVEGQMMVVAGRTHPAVGRRRLTLAALRDSERWTLSPPDTVAGSIAHAAFATAGLAPPELAVRCASVYMRLNLLHGGRFVSLLPATVTRHPMTRDWLVTLPVKVPPTPGAIGLIRLARRTASGAVRTFGAAVEAAAGA